MRSLLFFLSIIFFSSFTLSQQQCEESFFQTIKEVKKQHPIATGLGFLGAGLISYGVVEVEPLIFAVGGLAVTNTWFMIAPNIDSVTSRIKKEIKLETSPDRIFDIVTLKSLFYKIAPISYVNFSKEIELLVHKGLKVNSSVDINGNTPLHLVARYNNPTAIRTLKLLGADIYAVNSEGKNPMDIAVEFNSQKAIKVLKKMREQSFF